MTPDERSLWVREMGARTDWWRRRTETIVDPDRDVVDAHFHLWPERDFPDPQDGSMLRTSRYLLDEFLRDAQSGHRVTEGVYIECGSGHHAEGPAHLRPVGESAFAADCARRLQKSGSVTRIGAIVAHADLGHCELDSILDAHDLAGGGLVTAIRHSTARMEDPSARLLAGAAPPGLAAEPSFVRGVARLGERGYVFDAFAFHFQLAELAALARAAPATTMVINHLGAPIGFRRPEHEMEAIRAHWSAGIDALADLPNTVIKLGGLASIVTGYDGNKRPEPPSSDQFVAERGAFFHHAIRQFGPERCMFESNFPVDSISISYPVLWNAYKKIAKEYDAFAQAEMLSGTARRIYRIS